MCESVPVVRCLALLILLIAVGGALVGLVAPFWALYEPGLPLATPKTPHSVVDEAISSTTVKPNDGALESGSGIVYIAPWSKSSGLPAQTEGLWARCDANNFTYCILFCQNDFQLEFSFPIWHKVAQVLYLVGSFILVATLVIGFFHICCCCRCCAESSSLPTALGTLTIIGVLPILASIIVYGAMAYTERGITLIAPPTSKPGSAVSAASPGVGEVDSTSDQVRDATTAVFEWAYYVAVASVALCLLSAALLFCDGKRSSGLMVVDEKGRYRQQSSTVDNYGTG